jgi:GrpB-like predicted nucleotidyltransferase (UPF0157 family)
MAREETAVLGLGRETVRVVPAHPGWAELYRAEANRISEGVARAGLDSLSLEHVGSTAVPGLAAKPILDLMAGYPPDRGNAPYFEVLVALGYEPRGSRGIPGRELLVRGPETSRTHHLNLVERGGTFWREHLLFRDRLRADPATAEAYASLKRDLAARYPADREAYTAGKGPFIARVLLGAGGAAG